MPFSKKSLSFAALLSCVLPMTSFAGQSYHYDQTVPAGKSSSVAFEVIYNKITCHIAGKMDMSLPEKPKHGKVTFSWTTAPLKNGSNTCVGKPIKGMMVYYQPDKGYHGPETFRVGMRYPTFEGSTTTSYSEDIFSVMVK